MTSATVRLPSIAPPTNLDPEKVTVRSFLRKFSEVALVASFIAAVLTYHFVLPPEIMQRLYDWLGGMSGTVAPGEPHPPHVLFVRGLFLYVEGGAPVLELKSTVWLLCGGFVISGVLIARLYERALGLPVFTPVPTGPETPSTWMRRVPLIAVVGFIVWSAVSFSPWGWGPRPPAEALLGAEGAGSLFSQWEGVGGWRGWIAGIFTGRLAGREVGGGFHSLVAFLQVSVGLALFIATEEMIRTRRLVYKLLGLFMGLGVFVASCAIAVQAGVPVISDIWIKWAPGQYRNDMGGFIGHNAAISSFLIAPLLLTATMLLAHGRKLSRFIRGGMVLALGIMAMALLMAQSRAVIPILVVLVPVLLFLLARRALVRAPLGFWVAVPLVIGGIIITQLVDHPANPLYRRSLPLAMRVQHMRGDHLMTETRLRITAASLPVVRDNFLTGTGFGSFQYVYPEAQGLYYQQNPRSRIAPTPNRTFRAHNEYLQTLFETGIVGLGFALAGLIAILMAGWKALGASVRQRHIALQLAVLMSATGILLHCLFDFPLRVAPLAASLSLLLAIWSAGHRLWVIRVKPLEERPEVESEEGERSPTSSASNPIPVELQGWKRHAPWGVLAGASALCFAAILTLSGHAMNWYAAVVLRNQGQNSLSNYQTHGVHLLSTGDQRLEDATRLMPLMGDAMLYRAQIQYRMVTHHAREQLERFYAGEVPSPLVSPRMTDRALMLVNQSLGDTRFHVTYRDRALIHLFNSHHDQPNQQQHFREALADLERTVLMNPGDYEVLKMYIDWLERDSRPRENEIQEVYNTIAHFHPYAVESDLFFDFRAFSRTMAYNRALRLMRHLQAALPDDRSLRSELLRAAFKAGDNELAASLIEQVKRDGDPHGYITEASLAARAGNFERALAILRTAPARDQATRSAIELLRLIIEVGQADAAENDELVEEKLARIRELTEERPAYRELVGVMFHVILGDTERAVQLLHETAALPGFQPDTGYHASLAHLLTLRHQAELDRLEQALRRGQPATFESQTAYKDVSEALSHYRRAAQYSVWQTEQDVIRQRTRRLEMILGSAQPPT